jgi:hypothetical protein
MREQRQQKIAGLEAKRKAARDSRVARLEKWLNQQDEAFSFADCDSLIKWIEHGEEGRAYPHDVDLRQEFGAGAYVSKFLDIVNDVLANASRCDIRSTLCRTCAEQEGAGLRTTSFRLMRRRRRSACRN